VTLSGQDREQFWRAMERLAGHKAKVVGLSPRAADWVKPELRVKAKHLRCSGKLRHATLSGIAL
jgi:hypothetical protein